MYREEGQLTSDHAAKKIEWNDQPVGSAGAPGVVGGVLIFLVTTMWVLLIGGVLVWSIIPAEAIWPVTISFGLELIGAGALLGYVIWTVQRN